MAALNDAGAGGEWSKEHLAKLRWARGRLCSMGYEPEDQEHCEPHSAA